MRGFEWALTPWALALIGACVGSFLNVVIHRLPRMMGRDWWGDVADYLGDAANWRSSFAEEPPAAAGELAAQVDAKLAALPPYSLMRPGSACPACHTPIAWWHNLPIVGWVMLRGRCAACSVRISPRYPLVEALTAALFAAIAWRFGPQPLTLLWCAVAAVLVAASFIDWDTTLLPDSFTGPLLWAGLIAAALGLTVPLRDAVIGAVAGYLVLWGIYWVFKLATGKEGMGAGDFKLLAALGAWLGWPALLPIALMASIVGIAVGLAMKASGALREGRYVPFGPFLAGGGLAVLLMGTARVNAWVGL